MDQVNLVQTTAMVSFQQFQQLGFCQMNLFTRLNGLTIGNSEQAMESQEMTRFLISHTAPY